MNLATCLRLLGLVPVLLFAMACERDSTREGSDAVLELRAIFGEDLEHEDALRFASLSGELKTAMTAQAEVGGQASALSYLRKMPEEVQPISRLVTPDAMEKFQELDSERQRIVLLEGYAHGWERWRHDSPPSGKERFSLIIPMIFAAHAFLFPDGYKVPLPPYQDVLTSSEKGKLESMDPLLSTIYSRRWLSRRVSPSLVERLTDQLRNDLAHAPTAMPEILDSGPLEERWRSLWEESPEALDFSKQYLAHKLVTAGQLEPDDLDALDEEMMRLSDSNAGELFTSGFRPGDRPEAPTPLACEWDASTGVWLEWAVPSAFEHMNPQDLVLAMPPPMTVLSGAALDRLESLDTELRREFGRSWYMSSGSAQAMACLALRWDRYLNTLPLTELPAMSSLLTPQGLSLFEELPESRKQDVIDFAVQFIVEGRIRIGGVYGQPSQDVDAYGMSHEEFFRELRKTTEIAVNIVANWNS